jgi:hypothetical protein
VKDIQTFKYKYSKIGYIFISENALWYESFDNEIGRKLQNCLNVAAYASLENALWCESLANEIGRKLQNYIHVAAYASFSFIKLIILNYIWINKIMN